ncbi:MAG: hypothetical protein ACI3XR_06215 [Eubacteriales bacterium]
MKKLLSVLLVLAVLLPFVGCQNQNGQNDRTTEITNTNTSTSIGTTVAPPSSSPDSDGSSESPETAGLSLKCLSFNLRYDTTSHPLMATGIRGAHLMTVIEKYMPDSIGFCEATDDWMNYLRVEMGNLGYEYVGLGRDSGQDSPSLTGTGNEHTPVFYNATRFELVEGNTFWLSTTPDVAGSTDWNSACKRVCSYVVLKEKESGQIYAHFATHLDHVSEEAQHNSIRVIQSYINDVLKQYGDIGIVLSGDFNAVSFDLTNPDYRPVTYNFTTSFMDDSHAIAASVGVDGSTWSGFQNPTEWESGHASQSDKPNVDTDTSPIDYIFLSKGSADVSYYTVVDDTFTFDYNGKTWYNQPISDHYGVYIECSLYANRSSDPDESASIDIPAALTSSTALPAPSDGVSDLIADATLSSGLSSSVSALKEDGKYATLIARRSKSHVYWEITSDLGEPFSVTSVSFLTADTNCPVGAECFVSGDKTTWEKVGPSILGQTEPSTCYTWTLEQAVSAKYVKIVFFDCLPSTKLDRISVLGQEYDDGSVHLTPVSGPKSGQDEGYEKIIDKDLTTKFYINTSKDALSPLVFVADAAVAPTRYTLSTANDNSTYTDRLPEGWIIYGSADGENWTVIVEVVNPEMESKDYETYEYTMDSSEAYLYFKLEIDLASSGKVQFSEFALYSE